MCDNFINKISLNCLCEDSYLSEIDGLKKIKSLTFSKPITFFVGENGTGKSTLLEAIAQKIGFNHEGGSKNFNFSTYEDTSSLLAKYLTVSRGGKREKDSFFLRADNFFNLATYIEEIGADLTEYGDKPIHKQSHGEGMLNIINNRFRGSGLYLIDEPENGLSFQRQLSLISSINELVNEGSQFIIVTHSPILMSIPNSIIYSFDYNTPLEISLEETKAYEILSIFLNNKETLFRHLFEKTS